MTTEQREDLIRLAELEYTNALVHPDRYDATLRKKYLDDLNSYTDYNEMLQDYAKLLSEHAKVYPNDSQYLTQVHFYVSRLSTFTLFGSTFFKG